MGIPFIAHVTDTPHLEQMTPWWQDQLTVSIVLVIGFFALVGLARYAFKASFGATLLIAMAYLLVVGVLCYRVAPVVSIVALAGGMLIALTTTMLQLAHKNSPRK